MICTEVFKYIIRTFVYHMKPHWFQRNICCFCHAAALIVQKEKTVHTALVYDYYVTELLGFNAPDLLRNDF